MGKSDGPAHSKDTNDVLLLTGGGSGRRGEMRRKPGVREHGGHVMDKDTGGGWGAPRWRTEVTEHQAEASDQLLLPLRSQSVT